MTLPPPGVLSVRSSDEGHVIAVYTPLILVHLTKKFTPRALAALMAATDEGVRAGIRGGMLFVFARTDMASGIDPKAREVFERLIRANSDRAGGSAVVILTQGFGGAVARGALSGFVALTSRRKMLQIFGTVREACAWLAVEYGLEPSELESAYEQTVAHLGELRAKSVAPTSYR